MGSLQHRFNLILLILVLVATTIIPNILARDLRISDPSLTKCCKMLYDHKLRPHNNCGVVAYGEMAPYALMRFSWICDGLGLRPTPSPSTTFFGVPSTTDLI